MHIYAYLCISMHICVYLCIFMHMHIYAYLCISMHSYVYLCISVHRYAYLCIPMHIWLFFALNYLVPPKRYLLPAPVSGKRHGWHWQPSRNYMVPPTWPQSNEFGSSKPGDLQGGAATKEDPTLWGRDRRTQDLAHICLYMCTLAHMQAHVDACKNA